MSVIIDTDELKKASFLKSVTSKEHRYVRLSWGGNDLHFYSYDGTVLTRVALDCETTDVGEAVLLSDHWWGVVSNTNPGQLALEKLRTNLRATSGNQEVKLRMMPPENFVDVATVFSSSRNTLAAVMSKTLRAGLERIEYAMADARRPQLMATKAIFHKDVESVGFYATDGVKAAGAKIPAKVEVTISHIIPAKAVKHWGKLLPPDGPVRIFGSQSLVGIEFGKQWSCSQTIGAVFPPVEEILNPPDDVNFLVEKDGLMRAMRQALVFVDDAQTGMLELTADGSHVALTSEGLSGEFRELLKASVNKPMDILVNPSMVLDVLKQVPSEYVAVAQEGPNKPIYIRGLQDFGTSLVMPLRKRKAESAREEDGDF
jgi:DNA polymerase III sliding clamp (beta) subunit (PCNA family)